MDGCPVGVLIPHFLQTLVDGDLEKSAQMLKVRNNLSSICGRVCAQEKQCEEKCVVGIKGEPVAIGALEAFVADWEIKQGLHLRGLAESKRPPTGKKVAVVGAGPAGLTCAGDLAKLGHQVTVFEALHIPGGVLMYGIPEFRLPRWVIRAEIDKVRAVGVEIRTDHLIGRTSTIDDLLEEYDAVFLGTGAGAPTFLNIPGETLNGVYSGNEFLTRVNLMRAAYFPEWDTPVFRPKSMVCVGGGDTSMDVVRTARRLGVDPVYLVYRRSEVEMPSLMRERGHAKPEGVIFMTLTAPTRIIGDERGFVKAIECIKMELGEPDAKGRRQPIPVPGSEFILETDSVVVAVGATPNPLITQTTPGLETVGSKRLILKVDSKKKTTRDKVWAGGDVITVSEASVIRAMGDARRAAAEIHKFLTGEAVPEEFVVSEEAPPDIRYAAALRP